jgi:heme/copper-type cytochrome/quinol oxidase subunit 2
MNGTRDTNGTTAADNGGGFDPQEAAALIEQSKQHARRQFDPNPPLVYVITAFVILGVYGAVWLSVRGQHPYKGPTPAVIGIVYLLLAVMIIAFTVAARRAHAGIGGRSQRQRRAEATALTVVWIVVYVFDAALNHAGVSHAFVFGVFLAVGPLIIPGAAMAGIAAARQDWRGLAVALAVVVVGAVSAFAGPAQVWAVAGLGLFVVLLSAAAAAAWLHVPAGDPVNGRRTGALGDWPGTLGAG